MYIVTVEWPALEPGRGGTVEAIDFDSRPDAMAYCKTLLTTARCERPERVRLINEARGETELSIHSPMRATT